MGKALIYSNAKMSGETVTEPVTDATLSPDGALEGEVFYNNDGRQIGIIKKGTAVTKILESGEQVEIPSGMYDTSSYVKAKTMAELTGDAIATQNDIMENKTAYVNGEKITGTIKDRTNSTIPLCGYETIVAQPHPEDASQALITIPNTYDTSGYIDKTTKVTGNIANLKSEYIKSGVRVGRSSNHGADDTNSILGTFTDDGTITATDVVKNKVGYTKGAKVIGTMPDRSVAIVNGGDGDEILHPDWTSQTMSHTTLLQKGLYGANNMRNVLLMRVPNGYYNDSTRVFAEMSEVQKALSIDSNTILEGTTIADVAGTIPNLTNRTPIMFDSTNNTRVLGADAFYTSLNTDGVTRLTLRWGGDSGYILKSTLLGYPLSDIANALGITPDKIVAGQTVAGVTGTASTLTKVRITSNSSSSSGSDHVSWSNFNYDYVLVDIFDTSDIYSEPTGRIFISKSELQAMCNSAQTLGFSHEGYVIVTVSNWDEGDGFEVSKLKSRGYVIYGVNGSF